MLTWWGELIAIVVSFLSGIAVTWLFLQNNPNYVNVKKILKEEIQKKRDEIVKLVKEKAGEVAK